MNARNNALFENLKSFNNKIEPLKLNICYLIHKINNYESVVSLEDIDGVYDSLEQLDVAMETAENEIDFIADRIYSQIKEYHEEKERKTQLKKK